MLKTLPPVRRRPLLPLLQRHAEAVSVVGALALALVVRARYVLAAGFPLNDGGLFYVMIRELQRAHYRLPELTGYNGGAIPFAYPPLGFYVAGILSEVTHIDLLTVMRVLPLVVSTTAVGAFYLFARSVLTARSAAVAAVIAYALIPEGYAWLIMGGGLTRSFGMLFMILTLHQFVHLYRRRTPRRLVAATAFAGLALLSHLEAAFVVAVSVAVVWMCVGRNRRGVTTTLLVALGSLALTAPWWGTVIARHGFGPFRAAALTGGHGLSAQIARPLIVLDLTGEPMFPLIMACALLGLLVCWMQGRPFPIRWLVALVLLDPRAAPRYAALPLALLAGIAVAEVLVPLVARLEAHRGRPAGAGGARWATGAQVSLAAGVWVVALYYATMSSLVAGPVALGAITRDEREAFQWVAQHTAPSSAFLVVTGVDGGHVPGAALGLDRTRGWGNDGLSEWFPALAGRTSLATPQGHEWLAGFTRMEDQYYALQRCAGRDGACLDQWAAEWDREFSHVLVPAAPAATADDCCWSVRQALRQDARYAIVYDGRGATVFARRDPAPRVTAPGTGDARLR